MENTLIYKSDLYAEDFVLHKQGENKYYAFITEGTEKWQMIKRLKSDNPLYPFVFDTVIYTGSARLGSLTHNGYEWRLYFNEINPVNSSDRNISFISGQYVQEIITAKIVDDCSDKCSISFTNVTRTNLKCLDDFYNQPFCLYVNGEYVLFVNKVMNNGNTHCIHVYHSADGVKFRQKYLNPLLLPSKQLVYNGKIGNPCAVWDGKKYTIIAECNERNNGWRLCKFEWDGKDGVKYFHSAIMGEEKIRANPFLYKHDNGWILYYGIYNGKNYEVHAKEYKSLEEIK